MISLRFVKNQIPSLSVESQDLDVTPIMSMFIVLIPFLVSMAILTHLTIVEFSLPPNVGTGSGQSSEKPKVKLTVVITPQYLAITQGDQLLDSIPVTNDNYNWENLSEQLIKRKAAADIQDEVIVAVRDNVRFKFVVSTMDRCREAGFEKIGLSSATVDPKAGK